MSDNTYRIRTTVGNDTVLRVNFEQKYDLMEVLSLKITQEDTYKIYTSDYGVLVGRVIANDGFGVPNAKVSLFVKADRANMDYYAKRYLYPYDNLSVKRDDGYRYNLLPNVTDTYCHQDIGTFPSKRFLLDNDLLLEIYDEYYKFTTTTNESGDYMLFGIPTGSQTIHVDIDLSDIGVLSQKPRDMIYKGYSERQFESPNMFKTSTNLDDLPQVYTQDTTVFIYPFWGDSTNSEIAISRGDVNIQYKFEPTCVFLGCAFTDSPENTIAKNCKPYKRAGRMHTLVSSEGTIEMMRLGVDGESFEQVQIEGNRLIDGNGVWCYQIPMNLDYMITDEYGNMRLTDNPNKGIPTRTKVRFRVKLDDVGDYSKKKGAYLIPNNPTKKDDLDMNFENPDIGRLEVNFKDLFWNKVYSVKSYIPRTQVDTAYRTRSFTGIKTVNEYGQNNPFPYNRLFLQLPIAFSLLCAIVTFIIEMVNFINRFILAPLCFVASLLLDVIKPIERLANIGLPVIGRPFGFLNLIIRPIKKIIDWFIIPCITIGKGWCENDEAVYAPGCICPKSRGKTGNVAISRGKIIRCVINKLANEYGVINFDFYNDWINGALYLPNIQFKIKKKKKRRFLGLFGTKVVGEVTTYCGSREDNESAWDKSLNSFFRKYKGIKLIDACSLKFNENTTLQDSLHVPVVNIISSGNRNCKDRDCYQENANINIDKGTVRQFGDLYYYTPKVFEVSRTGYAHLYSTDIILLGGMNDCDRDGIPPLHQLLPSTTFNMPSDMVVTDRDDFDDEADPENESAYGGLITESSGVDWGLRGEDQGAFGGKGQSSGGPGGLFVGTECFRTFSREKSCINAERICELGVSIDERFMEYKTCGVIDYIPDGFISYDELLDSEARQMFATLNSNNLKIISDSIYPHKYSFLYQYPENFDGKLYNNMPNITNGDQIPRRYEQFDKYYHDFRFSNIDGENVDQLLVREYYAKNGGDYQFPKYMNSFYFYFGLRPGETAIDVFNNKFYTPCVVINKDPFIVTIRKINDYLICPCNNITKPSVEVLINETTFPVSVTIEDPMGNLTQVGDITKNKIIIGVGGDINIDMMPGTYAIKIIDNIGNEVNKTYEIRSSGTINFNISTVNVGGDLNNVTLNCDNYWQPQTVDDLMFKGKIILSDFNHSTIETKGCNLNNYELFLQRSIPNYEMVEDEETGEQYKVLVSYDVQPEVTSTWNLETKYNADDGVITIPVCIGRYRVGIRNKNKDGDCQEDIYYEDVDIVEPEPLKFYFNLIDVDIFKISSSLGDPPSGYNSYGDYYWIKLYEDLINNPRRKSNLLNYPKNSEGEEMVDNTDELAEFNQTIFDSFVNRCKFNFDVSLTANGGNAPYKIYTVGRRDITISDYFGQSKELPVSNSSENDTDKSPYKTDTINYFRGEYVTYGKNTSDVGNPNFSSAETPLGIQSSIRTNPIFCDEIELGGYYSVMVDNGGLGFSIPIGLNQFLTSQHVNDEDYIMSIDDFNGNTPSIPTLKNMVDSDGRPYGFFFHIIDKTIDVLKERSIIIAYNETSKWDLDGLQNGMARPCSGNIKNDGYISLFLLNGGDITNDAAAESGIYLGGTDFKYTVKNVTINGTTSKKTDIPYVRQIESTEPLVEQEYGFEVSDNDGCDTLLFEYDLTFKVNITKATLNENKDNLGEITFQPINGTTSYNYYLIKCDSFNELNNAKNPNTIIKTYYEDKNVCLNINNINTNNKFLEDISYKNGSFDTNTRTINDLDSGIYYIIVVDSLGVRNYSQPIDMRNNVNVNPPQIVSSGSDFKIVNITVNNIVNNQGLYSCPDNEYVYTLYLEDMDNLGEYLTAATSSGTSNGEYTFQNIRLENEQGIHVTARDLSGLVKMYYNDDYGN